MIEPRKRRNRQPKPVTTLGNITLEVWLADGKRIEWARTDPMFREVLTVLTNERGRASIYDPTVSENARLGRVQGYELALQVLSDMAKGAPRPEPPMPEPDYSGDTDLAHD